MIGVDNINKYYDTGLKKARLKDLFLTNKNKFSFFKTDIHNRKNLRIYLKKIKK